MRSAIAIVAATLAAGCGSGLASYNPMGPAEGPWDFYVVEETARTCEWTSPVDPASGARDLVNGFDVRLTRYAEFSIAAPDADPAATCEVTGRSFACDFGVVDRSPRPDATMRFRYRFLGRLDSPTVIVGQYQFVTDCEGAACESNAGRYGLGPLPCTIEGLYNSMLIDDVPET